MQNRLKTRLDAGKVAIGAQLRFGQPAIAELFALAGFDWVLIDSEHAPQTPTGIQAQLQAVSGTAATALVRVPTNDVDLIRLYLDMGALGIVAPFINTAEQAAVGASACRYPPRGTRGWGPHRASGYGLTAQEYTRSIDDNVLYVPIIESVEAVDSIADILMVDGVDACIIGPVDLSISLGRPFDFDNNFYRDAVSRVADAARACGKPAGIGVQGSPLDPGAGEREVADGFRLLLTGGDEWFLATACAGAVANLACLRESST